MASWDESEPNTAIWGVLQNTFKLPAQPGYLSKPFQWQDCKMGWENLAKTMTDLIINVLKSSVFKWQRCDPSVGPFLLNFLISGRQYLFLHTYSAPLSTSADLSCLETMSLITLCWRKKLFRRKTDPNPLQSFLVIYRGQRVTTYLQIPYHGQLFYTVSLHLLNHFSSYSTYGPTPLCRWGNRVLRQVTCRKQQSWL